MKHGLENTSVCPDAKGVFDGSVQGADRFSRGKTQKMPVGVLAARGDTGFGGPSGAPASVWVPGYMAPAVTETGDVLPVLRCRVCS